MATAQDIIKAALRKIGVLGVGQSLSAEEAQDGLDQLNRLLSRWAAEGDVIYNKTFENFPLSAGVSSYTIGTGQTFNTARPVNFLSGFVRNVTTDYGLTLWDYNQWSSTSDKTITGIPTNVFYDGNYPVATIRLYPTPDAAYTLYMWSEKPLTAFAGLSTAVDLPEGWEDALIYNLAVSLAPEYDRNANETVIALARETRGNVQRLNASRVYSVVPLDDMLRTMSESSFNIYTGGY